MSKFFITPNGASLNKEEVSVIVPQIDQKAQFFNIIAIMKNGTSIFVMQGLKSFNDACVIVDNLTGEIDSTYVIKNPLRVKSKNKIEEVIEEDDPFDDLETPEETNIREKREGVKYPDCDDEDAE